MTPEQKKKVKDMVVEIIEIPDDELIDDAKFVEDLGVDSMMALEIVAAVEKKFKIPISEEDIPKIQSLRDIYNLMEAHLNK